MKNKRLSKSERAFVEFLVNEVPRFDEAILADIRPTDAWIYNVTTGTELVSASTPEEVVNYVRWISENAVNKISSTPEREPILMGLPIEITQDRFKNIWPSITR